MVRRSVDSGFLLESEPGALLLLVLSGKASPDLALEFAAHHRISVAG
jgi:hypothetical protein